jgi:hypothetical protein
VSDPFLSTKLLTFMNYLTDINHHIEPDNNDRYTIIYSTPSYSGYCIYQITKPLSRFQQGNIIQMTECNMVDIISYINDKSPLNEGDLINLQMEIRTDSISKLKDYLSSGSISHI